MASCATSDVFTKQREKKIFKETGKGGHTLLIELSTGREIYWKVLEGVGSSKFKLGLVYQRREDNCSNGRGFSMSYKSYSGVLKPVAAKACQHRSHCQRK